MKELNWIYLVANQQQSASSKAFSFSAVSAKGRLARYSIVVAHTEKSMSKAGPKGPG